MIIPQRDVRIHVPIASVAMPNYGVLEECCEIEYSIRATLSIGPISACQTRYSGVLNVIDPSHRVARFSITGVLFVLVSLSASESRGDAPPVVGTRAGQIHPDFLLPKLDGEFGRLSDYRGKKVLLIHFASW